MVFDHGQVSVWRPDGALLQNAALIAAGSGIAEQNEALGLQITAESVACQWDGTPLSQALLADTVTALLWLEDRHLRDVEAMNAARAAAEPEPEPEPEDDVDYPDVIVIDDEDAA